MGSVISIYNWLLIVLILLVILNIIITTILLLNKYMSAIKLTEIQTPDADSFINQFNIQSQQLFFNISSYNSKIKTLNQNEINYIFSHFIQQDFNDSNIREVVYCLINTSSFLASVKLANRCIKNILFIQNSNHLSSFIKSVNRNILSRINKKYKVLMWEKVISVLTTLEYHSTNDMVLALSTSKEKIPQKYEKKIYIKLLIISKSDANQKNTAESMFINAHIRILRKLFLFCTREKYFNDYYRYKITIRKLRINPFHLFMYFKHKMICKWIEK